MSTLKNLVVIKFIEFEPGEKAPKDAEKQYDVLPKSWIYKENKIFKCFYPPPPWTVVKSMAKKLEDPDKSWQTLTIKCLFNTGKLETVIKEK